MTAPLVVASVPAGHAYVRHLAPVEPTAATAPVRRLPDPDPDHPDRDDLLAGERWWPPVMLRPDWLARADYDLLHVHFGYDDRSPDQLQRMLDVLADRGRPLVLTLHDLRNPHHPDSAVLDAQLDVLVPAAAALLTLTGAAADQVEARWGRRPRVVPHPHVVDLAAMAEIRSERRRRPRGGFRVGVACKGLRPNTDPLRLLPTLLDTLRDLPDARLEVTVHRDVADAPAAAPRGRAADLVDWLRRHDDDPVLDLVVHDRYDDAQLWRRLAGLDLAVLPYRFGTHSGWLEACHDVGTRVLAPSLGCYADQGADHVHLADESSVDGSSLAAALRAAYDAWAAGAPLAGLDPDQRRRQRDDVAAAHLDAYAEALALTRDLAGVPA